jgi:hypothetical protein
MHSFVDELCINAIPYENINTVASIRAHKFFGNFCAEFSRGADDDDAAAPPSSSCPTLNVLCQLYKLLTLEKYFAILEIPEFYEALFTASSIEDLANETEPEDQLALGVNFADSNFMLMQFKAAELFILNVWSRINLLADRRSGRSTSCPSNPAPENYHWWWSRFYASSSFEYDITIKDKCLVSRNNYCNYLSIFAKSFCDKTTILIDNVCPAKFIEIEGTSYNSLIHDAALDVITSNALSESEVERLTVYLSNNIGVSRSTRLNNINNEPFARMYDSDEGVATAHYTIDQLSALSDEEIDQIPPIHQSLMAIYGCMQLVEKTVFGRDGDEINGSIITWPAFVMLMHYIADYMTLITSVVLKSIASTDIPATELRNPAKIITNPSFFLINSEYLPTLIRLTDLTALAMSGFSHNLTHSFNFYLHYFCKGSPVDKCIQCLNGAESINEFAPEMMFGLVGYDIFEILNKKTYWHNDLAFHFEQHMHRYAAATSTDSDVWQDETYKRSFLTKSKKHLSRMYASIAPYSRINVVDAQSRNRANILACGFVSKSLESDPVDEYKNLSFVLTRHGNYMTLMTEKQLIATDQIGLWRSTMMLFRPQLRRIVNEGENCIRKAIVSINNSYYYGSFYQQDSVIRAPLRRDCLRALSSNTAHLCQLGEFVLDSAYDLKTSLHNFYALSKLWYYKYEAFDRRLSCTSLMLEIDPKYSSWYGLIISALYNFDHLPHAAWPSMLNWYMHTVDPSERLNIQLLDKSLSI